MDKKNSVVLISKGDRYQLLIDGVKVHGVHLLEIKKEPTGLSELTIKLKCSLETKEQ